VSSGARAIDWGVSGVEREAGDWLLDGGPEGGDWLPLGEELGVLRGMKDQGGYL